MEFGENLKIAREKKGITQQSLADELYVTRQAVSKWECGSRYPDLLTTKCIANKLGVTIDSLLSDDEMINYSEKQGITEAQKAGKIVSSLYGIVCTLSIVALIPSLINTLGFNTNEFTKIDSYAVLQIILLKLVPIALCLIVIVLSAIGFFKSVKDSLTPKLAGIIGIVFCSSLAIKDIITMLYQGLNWLYIVEIIFALAIGIYYIGKKEVFSKLIYALCGIAAIYLIIGPLCEMISLIKYNQFSNYSLPMITYFVNAIAGLAFIGIIYFQTIILERKRRISTNQ